MHETVRRGRPKPARHRDLHARPHRPRVRRRAVRGGRAYERVGAAACRSRTSCVPARFDRYKLTAGYNAVINQRQFKRAGTPVAGELPLPRRDVPQRRSTIDGRRRTLRAHPRARRDRRRDLGVGARAPQSLFTGDLFIWASPNCGNPQKVQRYAARLDRRVPRDGRARTRGAASRSRPADRRRRSRPASARRRRGAVWRRCSTRRSR